MDTNTNRLRHEDGTYNLHFSKNPSPLQAAFYTWNCIPFHIRELNKTSLFKKELKKFLINKYETFCTKDKCYVCDK